KPLELLKEAVPGTSRVVFIYDPATRPGTYGKTSLKVLEWEAYKRGIFLKALPLGDPDDIDHLFSRLPADTNGLLIENSVINIRGQKRICELAIERSLPTVGTFREFAT